MQRLFLNNASLSLIGTNNGRVENSHCWLFNLLNADIPLYCQMACVHIERPWTIIWKYNSYITWSNYKVPSNLPLWLNGSNCSFHIRMLCILISGQCRHIDAPERTTFTVTSLVVGSFGILTCTSTMQQQVLVCKDDQTWEKITLNCPGKSQPTLWPILHWRYSVSYISDVLPSEKGVGVLRVAGNSSWAFPLTLSSRLFTFSHRREPNSC